MGCPACAGVLELVHEDPSSRPYLQCTVGHKYSFESLLESKEEDLEKAMWSAVVLLHHIEMISRELMARYGSGKLQQVYDELQKRLNQGRRQAQILQALIEETVRPDLSPGSREIS
jgi:two-component system chemotaxis response regulator CheB